MTALYVKASDSPSSLTGYPMEPTPWAIAQDLDTANRQSQRLLRRWLGIGVLETLTALGLASLAPLLLNSPYPILGLLLWLGILLMLSGSLIHMLMSLWNAAQARKSFLNQFPAYQSLGILGFVGLSGPSVQHQLLLWNAAQADEGFQSLTISPFEFLRGVRQ